MFNFKIIVANIMKSPVKFKTCYNRLRLDQIILLYLLSMNTYLIMNRLAMILQQKIYS